MLSRRWRLAWTRTGSAASCARWRLSKRLGLVELGRHTGLSAALLSKIERGKMYPTLPTLLRDRSGVQRRPRALLRRLAPAPRSPSFGRQTGRRSRNGQALRGQPIGSSAWTIRSPTAPQFLLRRVRAGGAGRARPHDHDGAEVVYVITGTLAITIGGHEHTLRAGDSIYFDPSPAHNYRRVGSRACTAIVVTTP